MKAAEGSLKRGLSFKFLIFVNAVFIILGLILGVTLLIGFKLSFEKQLQNRGLSLASNIGTDYGPSISKGDSSLLPLVKGLARQDDIAYIIVLSNDGKVLAHSDESEMGKLLKDPLTDGAIKATQVNVLEYRQNTEDFYDVIAPVFLKSTEMENGRKVGVVRVGISLKNLQSEILKLFIVTFTVLGILICSGIFLSLFFVQVIIKPIERMTHLAVQIAKGDFRHTIEIKSNDEMGILAGAFSEMSQNLGSVIKKIQGTSHQITFVGDQILTNTRTVKEGALRQANTAEKTSSSIEQMNISVQNISDSIDSLSSSSQAASSSLIEMSAAINEVASSTTTLSSSVDDTTSFLNQMSGSIRQVAGNVDTLLASAEETTSSISDMHASIKEVGKNAKESSTLTERVSQDAAELGAVAIEKTIEGMEKIKKTVNESAQVISKLDERTEHIGKILTVIDEVTRQTNLLALNAAILAAQAGNEGRGFAVVADEIKNLADRTATSTKEIAQLIKDVQSEAKDAVISIKEGTRSVEEGVQLSTTARESLQKILQSSKRSSDVSRLIEQATLEQVKATMQVTELMKNMNAMIHRISEATNELGKGTLHITAASEKM
jgi:methyl-accepting chemotaxis protein